jgi:lactoylglutathione lyase
MPINKPTFEMTFFNTEPAMTVTDQKDNPNVRQAVPFFMVLNMDRSLQFYIDGLGFELKMKWEPHGVIEWCWLQLGHAALMLQAYRNNVPTEKRGVGVSVCFMCDDALTIHKQLISRGLSPAEPFVGNNLWVVELKDPDDYAIFFESPTHIPEGTTYSKWIRETDRD